MTFEEALAVPGRKVQVSGTEVKNGTRALLIFSVGTDGAQQLARIRLPEQEHDATVADLKARGLDVAETDFQSDATFVWIRNGDGIEIYDEDRKVFEAAGDRATFLGGSSIGRSDLVRVIAYADGYVHRGIKAALKSGDEVKLLTDVSLSATDDPTYTRNQLLFETEWCATVGIAIAKWAGVPFENNI